MITTTVMRFSAIRDNVESVFGLFVEREGYFKSILNNTRE